ncbi:alpha/beta hydrolase [Brevibacillus fluminis]|nr:alpha/beta hydrolase [Brevibacillus fluminis]
MAGTLFLPDGFDENKKYPAIIIVHSVEGVKEQTAG